MTPSVTDLIGKANYWAELNGDVVLSDWRVQLLRTIHATGSISAAALQLDIPYKLAWERIHEMEQRLGQPLLDVQTGGAGGGGATLTPLALDLVQRWGEFRRGLDASLVEHFVAAFGGGPDAS